MTGNTGQRMSKKIDKLRPWEKAVEHSFVLRVSQGSNLSFVMPLDGNAEAAGDSIFGVDALCILVEFKRDLEACGDELVKFAARLQSGNKEDAKKDVALAGAAYVHAITTLSIRDTHHYLVYGHWCSEAGKTCLGLQARTYFSEKIAENVEAIVKQKLGWTEAELTHYIRDFVQIKLFGAQSTLGREGEAENTGEGTNVDSGEASDSGGSGAQSCSEVASDKEIGEEVARATSSYIVAVSPVGTFIVPLTVAGPMLLRMTSRPKLAAQSKPPNGTI